MLASSSEWVIVLIGLGMLAAIGVVVGQSQVRKKVKGWDEKRKLLRSGRMSDKELEAWIEEGEKLAAECEGQAAADKSTREEFLSTARRIRDDIRAFEAARMSATLHADAKTTPTITELARLRSEGLITQDEFGAFAERFRVSSGRKAQEIIHAIEDLHRQRTSGAMSEGNYHASLWTLMDRLDGETKAR